MNRLAAVAAAFAVAGIASADRLEDYLQTSTITLDAAHVHLKIRMNPGTSVCSQVAADIDTDANGNFTGAEQRFYAQRVLDDLSLKVDGKLLAPWIDVYKFSEEKVMKTGRGEIDLDFEAFIPKGQGTRTLTFENHHKPKISAYLVNELLAKESTIRVGRQHRNPLQSQFEAEYVQSPDKPIAEPPTPTNSRGWLIGILAVSSAGGMIWRLRKRRQ